MSGAAPHRKPVGSILPASPGSGGHSWRSWARSRVAPASASVISWPSPWSLRPQFPLLVGTPLMGSGPPPVTSIAGRDPISKQGHVHTCPMGGAVLPRWSQTHPGECGTSTGRWLGLQEELRPWKDHGGPSGQQRARPREAGGRPAQPRVPGLTMQALVSSRLTAAACPGAPAPLWGDNPAGQAPQGCGPHRSRPPRAALRDTPLLTAAVLGEAHAHSGPCRERPPPQLLALKADWPFLPV